MIRLNRSENGIETIWVSFRCILLSGKLMSSAWGLRLNSFLRSILYTFSGAVTIAVVKFISPPLLSRSTSNEISNEMSISIVSKLIGLHEFSLINFCLKNIIVFRDFCHQSMWIVHIGVLALLWRRMKKKVIQHATWENN